MSSAETKTGITRLLAVVVIASFTVFVFARFEESLWSVIRWIDMLAPMPGLSGLALLAVSPVAFLVLAAVAQWVVAGFRPKRSQAC